MDPSPSQTDLRPSLSVRVRRAMAAVTAVHSAPDLGRGAAPPARLGREFWLVVATGVAMVTTHYYGRFWVIRDKVLPRRIEAGQSQIPWPEVDFAGHVWQGAIALALYAAVPVLFGCLLLRRSPAHFGLYVERRTFRAFGWAALAFVAALPVLWFASRFQMIHEVWPQYRTPLGHNSGWVDAAPGYADYFLVHLTWVIAVETLFRGVLLHGLYPRVGAAAIPVSALPYAALLFDLPLPMLALAFAGGLVLGWIALAGRSILPCIALHWAVAVALDLFCLDALGDVV